MTIRSSSRSALAQPMRGLDGADRLLVDWEHLTDRQAAAGHADR